MDWINQKFKLKSLIGKYRYVALVLLAGIVLMLLPSRQEQDNQTPLLQEVQAQTQDVQKELTHILSQIDGVGSVEVMLTIATGEKTVYQTDKESTENTSRVETVIITDTDRRQQGLIQRKEPPKYLGAIIVCKGAGNAAVKLAVVEAVSRATGLGADQISVLKMK